MKSAKYIFLLISTLLSLSVYSQKTLQLTDKISGKVRTFKIGQTVHLRTSETGEFEKAKIQNINDGTIVFFHPNEDEPNTISELSLDQIHSIRKMTCIHKTSQIVGSLFILGGTYMMLSSASLADVTSPSKGTYIGVGAGMFVLGAIPFFKKPKTYVLGVTHTAAIK